MRKKLINKKNKKLANKCHFCPCDNYELLDVHRINYKGEINKYTDQNTIIVCSLCHRKIHAGMIKIDKKYYSSSGRWLLHYFDENNVEHYD